jgi:hypothetical protein
MKCAFRGDALSSREFRLSKQEPTATQKGSSGYFDDSPVTYFPALLCGRLARFLPEEVTNTYIRIGCGQLPDSCFWQACFLQATAKAT